MLFRPTAFRTAVMAPPRRWVHSGTHWITSPGGAGDTAVAQTNAPARLIFPSATMGSWSFAAWVYDMGGGGGGAGPQFGTIPGNNPWLGIYQDGNYQLDLANAAGGVVGNISGPAPVAATWEHIAVTCDATTLRVYVNGVLEVATVAVAATYAAADASHLISAGSSGRIRSPALWNRALSTNEVSAVALDAPITHDLRSPYWDYLGLGQAGPVHWWPADGDSGTVVTDRGSAGTCNLTLHGGVTIGS